MKKSRWVWLPPQGDVRLLRFQEDVALKVGDTFRAFPPLLMAPENTPFPTKTELVEISLGKWLPREEGPYLEGPLPGLKFWLGWKAPEDWTVFSVPPYTWQTGRIAYFTWEPAGNGLFWSFSSWRPWR